jgi:proteasome accessory factor A
LRAASKIWRNPPDDEHAWLLCEWENVLNDLERDPMSTRDRIDWSAKKFLLDALQQDEKLSWSDPWLQSIDLEYHNINRDEGLYYELLRQGSMRRIVTEEETKAAIFTPPLSTRAYFRGRCVARFNDAIESIQWDEMVFRNGAQPYRIRFPEAAADGRLETLNALIREVPDYQKLLQSIAGF